MVAQQQAQGAGQVSMEQLMQQAEAIRQNMQLYEQRLDYMQALHEDKTRARDTLKAIEEAEGDEEILLPVGGDTFVRVKVTDHKEVLKGIGAGFVTDRPVAEARKALDEETEAVQKDVQQLTQALQQMQGEYQQLSSYLQRMGGLGGAGTEGA